MGDHRTIVQPGPATASHPHGSYRLMCSCGAQGQKRTTLLAAAKDATEHRTTYNR